MKKSREEKLIKSFTELEAIAVALSDRPLEMADVAFKLGLKFAIREIEGTEALFIKALEVVPYSDPKEAAREHYNLMNVLGTMKYTLLRRIEGRP